MKEIKFRVTVDEANLILEALGQMPFKQVFALIGQLQTQASEQLGETNHAQSETRKDD
ncbi:MAG: hypothetical protein AAGD38_11015 [Acidobacteriota bacterium]